MPQKVAPKRRTQPKRNNTTLIIGVGVIALVVVALLVLLNMNLDTRTGNPAPQTATGRTWGQANAPVTIDEYSDFQ
jgi:hypothetical protein